MEPRHQRAYLKAMGIPLFRARRAAAPGQGGAAEGGEPSGPAAEQMAGAGVVATPGHSVPKGSGEGKRVEEGLAEAPAQPVQEGAGDGAGALEALRGEVAGCTACPLHAGRTQTVFGVGDPDASVMFVGEAPGAEEDRLGEPFVGRAGKLLDAMLAAIGLDRQAGGVFIANVLKCRPPNNRDPEAAEVEQCEGYLRRQIELVAPDVLVALGRVAAQELTRSQQPLAKLRAREHAFHDTPLLITYHPAYLLRNPADKAKAWEDLKAVRRRIRSA